VFCLAEPRAGDSFITRPERGILGASLPSSLQQRTADNSLRSQQAPNRCCLSRQIRMTPRRGREARLKPEHASFYPGVKPGIWLPVETLIRHVTDIIYHDRSKMGVITGARLLHQEHFEYRGTSARPEGLPAGATRLSDSGAGPTQRGSARSSERESLKKKGQHE
jgi:hypothetical protein